MQQVDGLEILGSDSDAERAIKRIHSLRPDVVLVDGNEAGAAMPVELPVLLKDDARMRVINLHFGDNTMDIYDGQQVVATKLEDLISAILVAV